MKRIYLDVCCLNRPFDDQSQDRIRLEAEAIYILINAVSNMKLKWVSSGIVEDEIEKTPDIHKREGMIRLLEGITDYVHLSEEIINKGHSLAEAGFSPYDALHLAVCEYSGVDIFLTTDDKLVKLAKKVGKKVNVRTKNPVIWVREENFSW